MTTRWLTPQFKNMEPALQERPNWVLTKPEARDGKIIKRPFQSSGRLASPTDPSTWSTFETVRDAYLSGGWGAVGYVLDGKLHWNGLYVLGFDWDDCVVGGEIVPEVRSTLLEIGFEEVELSVSGKGLRAFLFHSEPVRSRKVRMNGRSVELYSGDRYMTTTGHKIRVSA